MKPGAQFYRGDRSGKRAITIDLTFAIGAPQPNPAFADRWKAGIPIGSSELRLDLSGRTA